LSEKEVTMPEPLGAHELSALAAEIADRIARDPALADSLAGGVAASLVCPPHKLCCFLGYNCDAPFTCARDFRCPQGFATQLSVEV
jgi:hypothetical protein